MGLSFGSLIILFYLCGMIELKISISTSKWFNIQRDVASFLDIKNNSKRAISSRCRQFGYGIEYPDYYGDYNIELNV